MVITLGQQYNVGEKRCLKKNLNASRPYEHPSVRGENAKTFRRDHRLKYCTQPLHGIVVYMYSKIDDATTTVVVDYNEKIRCTACRQFVDQFFYIDRLYMYRD